MLNVNHAEVGDTLYFAPDSVIEETDSSRTTRLGSLITLISSNADTVLSAGYFKNCCIVKEDIPFNIGNGNSLYHMEIFYWFSPGVGEILREKHGGMRYEPQYKRRELVSYSITDD